MSEVLGQLGKSFKDELLKKIVAGGVSVILFAAVSGLAYFRGIEPSLIAMFMLVGCPAAIYMALRIALLYRDLTAKRAELAIEYDPKVNLLPTYNNSSDVRLFVRNTSPKHAAKKLRVKIERVVVVGATRSHPEVGQISNAAMELERFNQGDDLPPHENVEAKGPVTFASNKVFFFRSEEKNPNGTQAAFYCDNSRQYRMTVFAVAENADPVRGDFIVSEKDGALYMDWDKAE